MLESIILKTSGDKQKLYTTCLHLHPPFQVFCCASAAFQKDLSVNTQVLDLHLTQYTSYRMEKDLAFHGTEKKSQVAVNIHRNHYDDNYSVIN